MPYYLTDDVTRDFPDLRVRPGVRALAVVPIVTGGEMLGMLAVDNCRSGRPVPESILASLFLGAGLAAQSLFAIYQQKERQRVEALRRSIYSEVFQAATNGKIVLCSPTEIAKEWPTLDVAVAIERDQDVAAVRDRVRETAEAAGVTPDRAWDLTLCASEAATNALRHGNGGAAAVEVRDGVVRIRIVDRGGGIPLEDLPDATLRPGWSKGSQPSMGHGFSLMYQLADCLYLNTGPDGTVLILEMHVTPRELHPAAWDGLL
jgi:anti-sigma regulatory factor (Ser/Thr protein kinase)